LGSDNDKPVTIWKLDGSGVSYLAKVIRTKRNEALKSKIDWGIVRM